MKRSPVLLFLLGIALLFFVAPLAGQADDGGTRAARAVRRDGPVHIDGVLDEAAWAAAPVATDFTQSYPQPAAAPSERTEIRVLYDAEALYVGARMFDSEPDSIAAQLARRDASGIYSDWIHVIIDSYHDRRTAFRFSVNPVGVKKDVYTSNDGNEDVSWDAVWDVATGKDSLGWVAEYRIPFSQLRFGGDADEDRTWGFQVMRDIARRDERDAWSPWTRQSPGLVSSFGDLTGIEGVTPPRRLEVQPYVSSRLIRAPGVDDDPFFHANDASASAGADVKMGLPAGLTLTGTINPDFGQVEVDPAVVNLTAYETFFPEKRPFFVEGADIFQFGQTGSHNNFGQYLYFYSRRIGRPPQRNLGGSQYAWIDEPEQTSIATAAKVSGKTPSGWSVGVLDAVTTSEDARYVTSAGQRGTAIVEPRTNYFVGRLRKDMRRGQSIVGGMVTATNRDLGDPALTGILRSSAYFGGVDFLHSWDNRQWSLSGYLSESAIHGEPEVIEAAQRSSARYYQRPDADYLEVDPMRTSLDGHMGEIALARSGRDGWIGSVDYREVSPGFELNDLGYLSRTDVRAFSTFLGFRQDEAGSWYRNYNAFAYANQAWDFGGDLIFDAYSAAGYAQLSNFWGLNGGITFAREVESNRLTRGGPLALSPREVSGYVGISTDPRRLVTVNVSGSGSRDALGGGSWSASTYFEARPTSSMQVSAGPTIEVSRSRQQYVRAVADPTAEATYGARYVFADLRQTTLSMDTRVSWTFTPTLSLQLYAQPFVSGGRYTGFKELAAPSSLDYTVYGRDAGALSRSDQNGFGVYTVDPDASGPGPSFQFADPDFSFRSLRGNAVLRWEYLPGSTVFFVWQQQRSGFEPIGDFDFNRDTHAIFRAPPTNVFLVKLTYWLGL